MSSVVLPEKYHPQYTSLAPYYDELMAAVPYQGWVEYVELLLSLEDHQARRVLDCACGTGNVSFLLEAQGYEVTGVDLSQAMIQVALAKAQTRHSGVRFLQRDLAALDLAERFDTATCLYDSLNYVLEAEHLQAVFVAIARHLEPGGIFIFDMNSEYSFEADLFSQQSRDARKALQYDWRAEFDAVTRICTVSMDFRKRLPDGSICLFHEVHQEKAYRLDDVKQYLRGAGLKPLRVFDAYTLNRPYAQSERWYFVAQRKH